MAPLKTDEIQNDTLTRNSISEQNNNSHNTMHPEAYKVKGPSPEKMKTVSESLRTYAHGIYGLL
ncbi:hypothetical protein [Pedobacter aquatilis]|uniref:hypothetical protein n=1 Tax=Pedobacter aquatilis TaxID=351343 RepID=UPI00292E8F25|nr:hypothetical protein [Pedobacter aquatilis]